MHKKEGEGGGLASFSKRAAQIVLLTAGLLGGIWLAQQGWQISSKLLVCLLLLLVAQRCRWWFLAATTTGLILGIWRGQILYEQQKAWESLYGSKVTLRGTVQDDPYRNDKGHMRFTLGEVQIGGQPLPGEVRVRSHYAWLERGFEIEAVGKLEKYEYGPQMAEIGFASVQVASRQTGWLEGMRQRFFSGMRNALPEPLAGFALSLLAGVRASLPKELQNDLAVTGLTHIVAVSGYNLTIIVRAVSRALGRFSIFLSTAVALWLVAGFVIFTGGSASIVRAAIVSGLTILATYYGYRIKPLAVLALAAGITALMNPAAPFKDLGWQLSFLAFYGILVLAPLVQKRWFPAAGMVGSMVLESTMAQLMTLPLIMHHFQQASLIAPLANLLVLPLIPLTMLASFVAALGGLFLGGEAGWVAIPAQVLMGVILQLIARLSGADWAGRAWQADFNSLLGIYLTITVLTVLVVAGVRRRRLPTDIINAQKEEVCPDTPSGHLLSIKKPSSTLGGDSRSPN